MPSTVTKRLRSRGARVLRATVVACASSWAVYLAGINLFLSSSLFERVIDGDPAVIDIHYGRGWSVIPGRIHARGLSIRGRDRNVEWILKLDEADFDMSFVALARRRFEVSRVRGRGISFRLRSRLEAAPATPLEIAQTADLPAIEGLPPWSVRPPKVVLAEVWSDAAYHLWSAHLEDIVADDVREIWIDRGHFEGDARIDGRFEFKPLRRVDVGPAHVAVRRGRVHVGSTPIAEDLAGTVDALLAPLDPRTAGTPELLHAVSGSTELRARLPEMASLLHAWPGDTSLTGAVEVRALALRVRAGVIRDGTHLDLAAPAVALQRGSHGLTGSIAATARVADARFGATFECTTLVLAREGRPIGEASRALVSIEARALDLVDLFGDLHVVLEVPRGQLADARVLDAYIPKGTPLAILGGQAEVTARIETWLAPRRASIEASLRADALTVRLAKLRVSGETTAAISLAGYRFDTGHIDEAALSVSVAEGTLAYVRAPARPLVDVAGLRLDAHAVDLAADDALRTLDARVVISDGSIVEPGLLEEYLPKGSAMRIRGGHGRFALAAELAIVDHLAKGTLDVHSKALGLTLHDLTLTAELRAQARVHDWRWEHGDLALDHAAVDITDVLVTRAGRRGLTVRRVLVTAHGARFDITDPLGSVAFSASIEGAHVRDPGVVNAFLPKDGTIGLDAEDGRFSALARATIRRHIARATIAASAESMGFKGNRVRLLGDTTLQAVVANWDLAKSTMAVTGAHVVVSNMKGGLGSEGDLQDVSARRVDLLVATPLLDLARPTPRGLDAHLIVDDAVLPDARALGAVLPLGSAFSIESGSARLSVDVEIASSSATGKGAIDVALSHAGIAIDKTTFTGDFAMTAKVSGFEPEAAKVDLSGATVTMRNVSVTHASTPTTGWSGDLVFDQAALDLEPRPSIEGGFHLEARDASPLFALVFRDEMPGALVALTSMDHLSASGRITADADGLWLDELDARGGDTRAHGSYASEGDERRGAFVVEKGPFGVGIRVGSGVRLRFFGLRGWLEDQRKRVEHVRAGASRKAKTP